MFSFTHFQIHTAASAIQLFFLQQLNNCIILSLSRAITQPTVSILFNLSVSLVWNMMAIQLINSHPRVISTNVFELG